MSQIQVIKAANPRKESVLIRPGANAADIQEIGPDGNPTGKVTEAQNILLTGSSKAEVLRNYYGRKH